jgi:phosphatidylglycerol lysyltransferase
VPIDVFARHYLVSIHIGSIISFSFLIYILVRPLVSHKYNYTKELEVARNIVLHHGKSATDYFKIQSDKNIFIPGNADCFLAYRMNSNFAIVLENPVAQNIAQTELCIKEFDTFCNENSLKSVFFRVPEESLEIYSKLGKKSMFIGQEAYIGLSQFDLTQPQFANLKAIHKSFTDLGYVVSLLEPPIDDEIIKDLKKISKDWFRFHPHSELTFMHGQFTETQLKNQSILAVKNSKNQYVAFLNLIPGYSEEIPSYDLLQYSANIPDDISDFILTELLLHLKNKNFKSFNLGFVPGSESDAIESYTKRSIQYAYEKIRLLSHFKGLRDSKEKYNPDWKNAYLIFQNSYDLLQIPDALKRIFKPV